MTSKRKPPTAGESLRAQLDASLPPGAEWDEREALMIDLAAAQVDDIATLEGVLADQGAIVPGSAGQPRLHPALAEVRQARLALGKLLAEIRLPDEGIGTSRHVQQQRAARARWDRERARREGAHREGA